MKENIIKWSVLLINIALGTTFIFALNDAQIGTNFSYERGNIFLSNYFFAAIALYYMYACNTEKLVKREEMSVAKFFKMTLLTLFFSVLLHEYGIATEFVIILNVVVILFFYKKVRLLLLVIPVVVALAFLSEQYLNYSNRTMYASCQAIDLRDDQVEECVQKFKVYNFRTETTRYLTDINVKLAKGNEKIKQLIQKKIIEKNEDENCKINEEYEVMQTKTKRGIPCMG